MESKRRRNISYINSEIKMSSFPLFNRCLKQQIQSIESCIKSRTQSLSWWFIKICRHYLIIFIYKQNLCSLRVQSHVLRFAFSCNYFSFRLGTLSESFFFAKMREKTKRKNYRSIFHFHSRCIAMSWIQSDLFSAVSPSWRWKRCESEWNLWW